ncbi:putative membrane protein [Marinomonas primoryensis]|uniref:Putative membrane protein n=1 Tax=Marinomonas primoryensis TaxID=178399 RepID=A0A859CS78_9GAMM|nr:putative membrane protein [Marinomonas primoryensis]
MFFTLLSPYIRHLNTSLRLFIMALVIVPIMNFAVSFLQK